MASEGYPRDISHPSDEELKTIREWAAPDWHGLLAYVRELWWQPDWGWAGVKTIDGRFVFDISTGGWSGNENLIKALEGNTLFWTLCWWSSRRGGYYEFRVPLPPPGGE